MREVSVTELKDRLSHYLRVVKAGETVEMTERSIPIAVLVRRSPDNGGGPVLDQLVRDGLVIAARKPPDFETIRKPTLPCRGDLVASLVEARGER